MIKYSVIGTSWITKSFIDGASLHNELVLDGVYSRSLQKGSDFARQTGAKRVFRDFSELLMSDTELVYVASPNSCHYEQCKQLLLNGKNIICEKPVTTTAAEFCELCDISDSKNLVFFEAIMYMHAPAREILKQAVSRIGKIRSASIDFSQLSSKYPALIRGENPNIFNPEMKTGALNDLGVYCVYPVVDIFGMPQKIIPYQNFLSTGADGNGSAIFVYDDLVVTITYSKVGQSRAPSQITGDEGTLTIGSISKTDDICIYNNKGNREVLVPDIEKKYLMGNEALSALRFIEEKEKYARHYKECRDINKNVLECMEKMRVKNA